jgi:hypothetical protein
MTAIEDRGASTSVFTPVVVAVEVIAAVEEPRLVGRVRNKHHASRMTRHRNDPRDDLAEESTITTRPRS